MEYLKKYGLRQGQEYELCNATRNVFGLSCLYKIIVEHIPAITYVATIDEYSSFIYIGPQVESLLGFTQIEWITDKKLWLRQVYPDDREVLFKRLSHIRYDPVPQVCEYRIFRRDGEIIWLCDTSEVVYNEIENVPMLCGKIEDISKYKQLEYELAEVRQQIRLIKQREFTDRELLLLHLIQQGYTDKIISQYLSISERTIGYWLKRLYIKLGVKKRVEAIQAAQELGLFNI